MVGFTTVTIISHTFRSLGKQTWGVSYRGNCLSSQEKSAALTLSILEFLFLTWNDGFIKKLYALPEFHQPELVIQKKKNSLHFLLSIADIMEVNICQADDRVDGTEGNKNTNTQISGRARLIFGVGVSRDHCSHGGGTTPISLDAVHVASADSTYHLLMQGRLPCRKHLQTFVINLFMSLCYIITL